MTSFSVSKPLAFFKRDLKIAASYRLQFLLQAFAILFSTASFFLISKLFAGQNVEPLAPYGGDYFSFVLIGIALTDYLTISSNSFATEIRNAQIMGTLESLLVTPTSIITILLSSFTYKLLSSSVRTLSYLLLGIFVFGVRFPDVHFVPLLFSFILTLLPFIGLGLFSAAFIIVFKRGSPISMLMAMCGSLLGGVLYPVSVLPSWLKPVSALLPITYGLEAMRQIFLQGAGLAEITTELYYLLIFSVIFMVVGVYSTYKALKIARQEGSLLHY